MSKFWKTLIASAALAVALGMTASQPSLAQNAPVQGSDDEAIYLALESKLIRQTAALQSALAEPTVQAQIVELNSWLADLGTWESHFEDQRVRNPWPPNLQVAIASYAHTARQVQKIGEDLRLKLIGTCYAPHSTLHGMQLVVPEQYKAHRTKLTATKEEVYKACAVLETAVRRTNQFTIKAMQYRHDRTRNVQRTDEESDFLSARDVLEQRLY